MVQPVWITPEGSLGTFPSGTTISVQVFAKPVYPGTYVTYKLLSGSLPAGQNITLSKDGVITGKLDFLANNQTYNFTIRCTDDALNVRDRSFSITSSGAVAPSFTTPSGRLLETFDSKWVDLKVGFNNPVSTNEVIIQQTLGELPPGLEISEDGRIRGYPNPPLAAGRPIDRIYTFTLTLSSPLGNDVRVYSISVKNWSLKNPSNSRIPAILNTRPATFNLNPYDPFYSYYTGNTVPVFNSGDFFAFKIIGKDFDGGGLSYEFKNLPLGLTGDTSTGWVSGKPTLGGVYISEFRFQARVKKVNKPLIASDFQEFKFIVSNEVKNDITWLTESDLGYISNGQISDFSVRASSKYRLEYRLVSGTFPPNLSLIETGDIVGRVAQQPKDTLMELGDTETWTFTVEAFSPQYPLLVNSRTFTITVSYDYPEAYENLYFKATLAVSDRKVLNTLLTSDELIPSNYIYRPNDPYFGKSKEIKYVHAYGVKSSNLNQYLEAVKNNHYWRQVILGNLKTAYAKDKDGNIIYEVVYSSVIDDLVNQEGKSIPSSIYWPRPISLNLGPWTINNTEIFTSFEDIQGINYNTSMSPGTVRRLYPASFRNMRETIADKIGENYSSTLLPRWMTTQQDNGVILGYIQAWVLCYTLPRMVVDGQLLTYEQFAFYNLDRSKYLSCAETIRENILNHWDYRVNRFNFTVDRYLVDKTATFDFNTNLNPPRWNQLPSATPEPNPIDSKDYAVLFPQKTILPKDTDYN